MEGDRDTYTFTVTEGTDTKGVETRGIFVLS